MLQFQASSSPFGPSTEGTKFHAQPPNVTLSCSFPTAHSPLPCSRLHHGVQTNCGFAELLIQSKPGVRRLERESLTLTSISAEVKNKWSHSSHAVMSGIGARCWWRGWLSHCATSRKVAGLIPDGVTGFFFIDIILLAAQWPWGQLSL
jgi:hypothetical protein